MSPEFESFLLSVVLQLAVIIVAARLGGSLFRRLGQPRVVGEIVAGLVLGPSCLGRVAPELVGRVFPPETRTLFEVLGQLGLMFLMFLVGLEFDFSHLRRHGRSAALIAAAGIVVPFALGASLAGVMRSHVAAELDGAGFVLFMATALSITAIPVLGRILMDLDLQRTRLGSLTITAAAVDDALGWILLAAVSAIVAGHFELTVVARTLGLTAAFVLGARLVARPLIVRWLEGTPPREIGAAGFSVLVILVLLAAAATNAIGIFSIFGPFVLGAVLCDRDRIRAAVRSRLDDFVTVFFLPIFFTYTGLKTDVGLLDSGLLWLFCGLVTLVACAGKILGCGAAARLGGLSWRESSAIAVLMNTRALMGLVAINVGRDMGVIPDSVFCMLVIMAVATTLMTSPILRRLVRDGVGGG